jgi:redox-sensing transcriptional repressor
MADGTGSCQREFVHSVSFVTTAMKPVSHKVVGRLCLYRRLLREMQADGQAFAFSYDLASRAGASAAQVRRDLMAVGFAGNPARGYETRGLIDAIGQLLDPPRPQNVALVGIGNLGRAILAFLAGRRPHLRIVAAFDRDRSKVGRVVHGCRCHAIDELPGVVRDRDIELGLVTVPVAEAQAVAEMLVLAGVAGLLNFAPTRLQVPARVHVENIDMTVSLERVAFFARHPRAQREMMV